MSTRKKGSLKQPADSDRSVWQPAPTAASSSPQPGPLERLAARWGALICLFCLAAVGFFVLRDYLLGKKVYLFLDIGSDITNSFYPYYKLTADYLRQEGFPKWSFQRGMGQFTLPYSLSFPLHYLVFWTDPDRIPQTMAYVEWLRFITAGGLMYAYLRVVGTRPLVAILGSVCYGYSGYMVLTNGWYSSLGNEQIYTVLTLIGIELLLRRNRWYVLPVAVCFIAIDAPFNLLTIGQFSVVYLLVRLLVERYSWRTGGLLTLRIVALSVLGIGIGAYLFGANLHTLLNSPRVGGSSSYTSTLLQRPLFSLVNGLQGYTTLLRLYGNDLLGVGNAFRGWNNYMEAPALYVGLISLLLFPQLFVLGPKRERAIYAGAAALAVAVLLFPYLRYAFWAFSGDYYRTLAMLIGTGLLLGSMKVANAIFEGWRPNRAVLTATLLLLLMGLFFRFMPQLASSVNRPVRGATAFFLLAYTGLLFTVGGVLKQWTRPLLLVLVCLEVGYLSFITLNRRDVLTTRQLNDRIGYNDYTREGLDYINSRDKTFFRVEKDYSSGPAMHSSLNDPMVQGYRGTTSYNSFNQKSYIDFLTQFGLIKASNEFEARWAPGVRTRPLLMPVTTVKYALSKGRIPYKRFGFDSLARFNDVTVWKNRYALPLGITYDQYYTDTFFNRLSTTQKDFGSLRGFVIKSGEKNRYAGFTELTDSVSQLTYTAFQQIVDARRQDTLRITSFSENRFDGTIAVDKPKLLFLSIPFDTGWKAEIDGKPAELHLVTYGMSGLRLEKGQHTVRIVYEVPYAPITSLISVGSIGFCVILYFITVNRKRRKNASLLTTTA